MISPRIEELQYHQRVLYTAPNLSGSPVHAVVHRIDLDRGRVELRDDAGGWHHLDRDHLHYLRTLGRPS